MRQSDGDIQLRPSHDTKKRVNLIKWTWLLRNPQTQRLTAGRDINMFGIKRSHKSS
jgi:hypothetical protein